MAARSSTVANSTTTISMLRRLLLHERRDTPLQLGKLDGLHEHAVARHFGQSPAGQVRDVSRKKEQALGEGRALVLQTLIEFRTVHPRHPEIRKNHVRFESLLQPLQRRQAVPRLPDLGAA